MITKKLYQEDVYKKECESTILEVQGTGSAGDPFRLVLDQTVFFPTGGGQPCDLGTIGGVPVTDVSEKDGKIFHKLLTDSGRPLPEAAEHAADPSVAGNPLKAGWSAGAKVRCSLDWDRRLEHMQRHCGEHILSGIFFRECGGVNRGFHMGNNYMTIDIDVPGIAWEEAQRIETLTNEVIWADVPVTVRYYKDRSEAEKLPLRKALAIDDDISIVCVGDESNPADCVACCGTHPSTSGQVGLVKIFKLENYKGMTRVYFDAGRRALEDYQNKHRILTELNLRYSSDDKDLLGKMKAQDEKNKDIRQELYLLKNTFIANAVDEILQNYGVDDTAAPNGGSQDPGAEFTDDRLLIREYPQLRANDLLTVTKTLMEKLGSLKHKAPLIALVSTQENIAILASTGNHDCGKIVKDNAHVWNGKGGGNAASARAMFPGREDLNCFITFIRQAYSVKK